jgi:hypothetical protein
LRSSKKCEALNIPGSKSPLLRRPSDSTGGSHVTVFSHVVRDRLDLATEAEKDGPNSPARRPHADFDVEACFSFITGTRPQLAEVIKSGKRWQIMGIWRPLKTVKRDSLALLDAQSVENCDYVKLPHDYHGRALTVTILKHGNGAEHKWSYLHEQQPNEAWIFKHLDSLEQDGNVHMSLLPFPEPRIFLLGRVSSFEPWCCIEFCITSLECRDE